MTNQNPSGPGGPCVLGLGPCVVHTNFNGTNLLWDDMKRTLAFAWELHVFGSASLFILMAALAVFGLAGASTLPYPLCDALTLLNSLLILSATLRAVLLLLDPYGTCQILSRATLAALQNTPLQLLLWAQMLSLSWGFPFCMGVLTQSLSHLHPSVSSSVPQWAPSHRIEKRSERVTAVCAFFGVLCCSLQMYSLLWLYGLLGNWRRFGWGWWLSQFWARILELAWGFSLLVLGSWIFWTPSRGHSRGDHGQGREFDMRPPSPINLRRSIDNALHHGQLVAGALHSLMDAKLKRMDPSVLCGDNLMTLKVKQTRAPRFLVDSGEGPIPLSQMPSSCGYFVKRSRRDVLFAAPYQGCHVTQQGGNYVLPLRLSGAPMTMSCPTVSPLPSISCFPTGMVLKIVGVTASELKVKVSGTWKSLSSICSSCGFAVEELSGGLTLTAPYPGGSCIEIKCFLGPLLKHRVPLLPQMHRHHNFHSFLQVLLQAPGLTLKTKKCLQLSNLHSRSCHSIHSSLSSPCFPDLCHQYSLQLIKTLLLLRHNYLR
eukprot:superscaffoldBa00005058_g19847